MNAQVDVPEVSGFLKKILKEHGDEKELDWINQQEKKLSGNYSQRSFYLAFSSAARFIGKRKLKLNEEQLINAARIRKGWQPGKWNLLQSVRTYFLLMLPDEDPDEYVSQCKQLQEAADIEEQVSLYAALPLLPCPMKLAARAAEGIRTNITDVFDAIALNNPYPADFLDTKAWNQMVLKAVFMQRPLYRIYGAEERLNPELAEMLIDFAHERWAASREVVPELWRFIGPFLDKGYLPDLQRAVQGGAVERKAALLACAESELPEAQQIVDQYPAIKEDIDKRRLNWTMIGEKSSEL